MRSSPLRTRKYEAKISGDVAKQRYDATKQMAVAMLRKAHAEQFAIENAVRTLMPGIRRTELMSVMVCAKQMEKEKDAQMRETIYNTWAARGINFIKLFRLTKLMFGLRPELKAECPIDNLMLNVPFYEGEGTKVHDRSGFRRDGTTYNTAWTTGKIGNAMQFMGANSYVDCGLFNVTEYTIEGWFYKTSLPSVWLALVAKSAIDNMDISMVLDPSDKIRIQHRSTDNSEQYLHSNVVLPKNQWVHLACKFVLNDKFYIYLNGALAASGMTNGTATKPPRTSTRTWKIGYDRGTCNYYGKIDEVRVWNRPLTEQEIKEIYEATV
jgi:hypothetical protein